MPITVKWDNEARDTVLIAMVGDWTLDELFASIETETALQAEVPHRVYAVVDVTHSGKAPSGVLPKMAKLHRESPTEGREMMIVVGATGFLERLSQIFSTTFSQHQSAETMDDAYALIEAHRSSK